MGAAILNSMAEAGFAVAITARSRDVLDSAAAEHTAKGQTVKAYTCDLAHPSTLPALLTAVAADLGPIEVAIYNATQLRFAPSPSADELTGAVHVNITSLHTVFNTLLPAWEAAGKGTMILTGGGLSMNGAWSLQLDAPLCAAAKAYYKNFAESQHATFSASGIHVCCLTICGAVGGTKAHNAPADVDFNQKVGNTYATVALAPRPLWVPEIKIWPNAPFTTEVYAGVCTTPNIATQGFKLNHTMLRVKDPKVSLDFYTRVIGLSVLRKLEFPAMKFTLYFLYQGDASTAIPANEEERTKFLFDQRGVLELTHNWGTEDQPDFTYHNGNTQPQGFGHICISVPDLAAAVAWFDSNGVAYAKRPEQGSMRNIAFIKDPDGYWIEIVDPSLCGSLGK